MTDEPHAPEVMAPPVTETEAPKPKKSATVSARVIRDYWPTENEADRVRAGTVAEVSKDALIDGMEKGVLERVKE